VNAARGRGRAGLVSLAVGFLLLGAAAWACLTSPRVPYNVRELTEGRPPEVTAPLLALLFYVTFGVPAWIASGPLRRRTVPAAVLPLIVLLQGTLVWLLLRTTVPTEAIHDIVGSPVLGGSREAETAGRFLGLFVGVATSLLGAAAIWIAWEDRASRTAVLSRWAIAAAVMIPLSYAIVVPFAATDNLTELMRGGGGVVSAAALGAAVAVLGAAGSGVSRRLAGVTPGSLRTVLVVLVALAGGYLLLLAGTEPALTKYGRTFSGLQFLLSEDRSHLASGGALFLRYALAFVAGVILIAVTQHPAWLAGARREGQGGSV
jgi:hypothetical protein